ncbi:ABC transporter ATP-binding protein [Phenylobacterium sp.]|uniref:ABC transporter ATP-binding protein n=1 Tax=Phenylobacterium sp. TaxID=1871053 RepID=UPI002FC61704
MSELVVEGLSKHFGGVRAVDDVSFTVGDGEFVTLLGPSGCGKSTTLFAVAGLDTPTGGKISVGDQVFFDAARGLNVRPERRNCGLVFQSYALWPHMTVAQNLAFPLSIRKVPKSERARRIDEALSLVEMESYAARYPHELSGGQQQRVALARTLVFEPSLLLLDEPLSNLDAKLRIRARDWLKQLQRRLAITTIYVTHDQIEALALSDRIAVMQGGKIVQLATPQEIYRRPTSSFVADFIGSSNFLKGRLIDRSPEFEAVVEVQGSRFAAAWSPQLAPGDDVLLAVRPEHVRLSAKRPVGVNGNVLQGRILDRSYLGARYHYSIQTSGAAIAAETEDLLESPDVFASFAPEHAVAIRP